MARPTALGALLASAGGAAFLVAFVAGSLAPALAGLVLLAFAEGARRELGRAHVTATRRLPPLAEVGVEATVRTEARVEPPLPLRVRAEAPAALRVLDRRDEPGRGEAAEELRVRPTEPGLARWTDARATVADAWGLHEREIAVPLPGALPVRPESRWRAVGRAAGRRHPTETTVRGRRSLETVPEVENVRPYLPGDRFRDVDWPRSARLQALFTRERQRVGPRPVLVLLDATASMRWRRRVPKLTTAARIAYGVAAAAEANGVPAAVVVFDERGVTHARDPTTGRSAVVEALRRISALEPGVPVVAPPAPADAARPVDEAERAFLARAGPFVRGAAPGAPPLDAALAELTRGASERALVVALLDAETSPRLAEVAARRLVAHGLRTLVVAPSTPGHHWSRAEARGPVLRAAVEARARRERARRRLAVHGVPLLVARPGDEASVLEEVARWAE